MTEREIFFERMESELLANSHKGDWGAWAPTPDACLSELEHHMEKLRQAFRDGLPELVREYAADVANIAQKAHAIATNQKEAKL